MGILFLRLKVSRQKAHASAKVLARTIPIILYRNKRQLCQEEADLALHNEQVMMEGRY